MGFSLSWIAVRGKTVDAIHVELGLKGTGEKKAGASRPFAAISMPTGWYVVIDDNTCTLLNDNVLTKLSKSCEVITCSVEEHVMFSSATQWDDGRNIWRVEHSSERGIDDLKCGGELPPALAPIRDRLFATQKSDTSSFQGHGVDHIFDIPLELARELTGYRHDVKIIGVDTEPYEILEAVAPPAKPRTLFQRLFGR